ncbi:hypothetical protein D3C81_2304310 [compost metagenome]
MEPAFNVEIRNNGITASRQNTKLAPDDRLVGFPGQQCRFLADVLVELAFTLQNNQGIG